MLVVGEASGDIHAAEVVKAIRSRDGNVKIFGVAGEQLSQLPFEALFHVSRLTGMGLVELAGNLKNIWQAYSLLRQALRRRRPSLLILIDFPEFNLRLARLAKSLNIPVLYYISPQIWAWRKGRVRQIARWVDRMAVVFPFEVDFYRKHGVNVEFVGHPLLETVKVEKSPADVCAALGLTPGVLTIGLLPGSRSREVGALLPIMVEAAGVLAKERSVQFVCVRASTIDPAQMQLLVDGAATKITVVSENRYDVVNATDFVWIASGTATLETALLRKPMVVLYRLSRLTYWLARMLVRVDHIGMVNLIAGERLVPELIQEEANPQRLVAETHRILDNCALRQNIADKLAGLRSRLGDVGAARRVADLALGMMV